MILRKIKRLLGMGSGSDETGRSERDVVVQEESSSADAETEAAVKGVDEGAIDSGDETEEHENETTEGEEEPAEPTDESAEDSDEADEPVAAGTDAGASTESLVDETEANEDPETRAEPAEAAGPDTDEASTEIETETPDEKDTAADTTTEDADTDSDDGTDVDEIKGIGPAYSDRLGEVGIHTVSQLAAADAADLAERITVAERTVRKWIDRAQESED